MTDRELLEMAAKACGYDTSHPWNEERLKLDPPVESLFVDGVSTAWNPLEDYEDALRLAVKLGLTISIDVGAMNATMVINGNSSVRIVEKHDVGSDCATRRAIVRAAAEIGKGLPK